MITSTPPLGAAIFLGASYLPSLQAALRSVQDADTALLNRTPGAVSEAMRLHREASMGMRRLIQAGGGR